MNKTELSIRLDERNRAVKIAYLFKDEHSLAYESKKKAGNELAFIEEKISNECRLIGNAISGNNALGSALGYTMEDMIMNEHSDKTSSVDNSHIDDYINDKDIIKMSMAIRNQILEKAGVSVEKRQHINDYCDDIIINIFRNFESRIKQDIINLLPEKYNKNTSTVEHKIHSICHDLNTSNQELNQITTSTKKLISDTIVGTTNGVMNWIKSDNVIIINKLTRSEIHYAEINLKEKPESMFEEYIAPELEKVNIIYTFGED